MVSREVGKSGRSEGIYSMEMLKRSFDRGGRRSRMLEEGELLDSNEMVATSARSR